MNGSNKTVIRSEAPKNNQNVQQIISNTTIKYTHTFQEVYTLWVAKRWSSFEASNHKKFLASHKHCEPLHALIFSDITQYQMEECINNCKRSYATQQGIKTFLIKLQHFTREEWGNSYPMLANATLLKTSTPPSKKTNPFTDLEIIKLLHHSSTDWVDSVLFLIMTGCNLETLFYLKMKDIHWDTNQILDNSTSAPISIPSPLLPLLKRRVEKNEDRSEYLFTTSSGKQLCESTYRFFWQKVMGTLNLTHTPKDCRSTYDYFLNKYGTTYISVEFGAFV